MKTSSFHKWVVSALLMGAVVLASAAGEQSQSAADVQKEKTMPSFRSILLSIVMLCLTVLITPGLHAYPSTVPDYPGLSAVAVDRVYLAAGTTDKDEEATIGDPDEQATVGDTGEQATVGDPDEQATVSDPREKAGIRDTGEAATIGDPGEKSSF
jgi:hypothetical protein